MAAVKATTEELAAANGTINEMREQIRLGPPAQGVPVPAQVVKGTPVSTKEWLTTKAWSTLKFAARMQSVTNMAAINSQAEVSPAAALAACQAQLTDLKRELAMHDQLAGRAHAIQVGEYVRVPRK